jgi:cephalosporin hydroxylase
MHQESFQEMARLVSEYLSPGQTTLVLDVGSYDVNGSYRPLFNKPGWRYAGADVQPGPNVDHVLADLYRWRFPDAAFDVVISGQAFEHIKFFWKTWREMVRVLKPGGLIFLIVPSTGYEHRHPVDCWRFYRDGMWALAEAERVKVLEAETHPEREWGDTVGVFRKPRNWRSVADEPRHPPEPGPLQRLWQRFGPRTPAQPPPANANATLTALTLADWVQCHQEIVVSPDDPPRWLGVPTQKNPLDIWIYQEILWEVRPQVVVELGSFAGGSALFLCHMLELLGGEGVVVSIDRDRGHFQARHERLRLITGDCADPAVIAQVRAACAGERALVIHDADHGLDAVLRDLRAYAPLVAVDSYLIVEDGIVDTVALPGWQGPGPLAAVQAFLAENGEFEVDRRRERYLLSYNPGGYLRRVRPPMAGVGAA